MKKTGPKVLLVDDDPAVRRSIQLVLQWRGFDVRAYGNPTDLLNDPNLGEAECLVADYRLQNNDGLALLDSLRARRWMGSAVLITAFPSVDLTSEASRLGYDVVLEKPFREQQLADTVARLVSARTAA